MDQNVFQFDVPVNYVSRMQILKCAEKLNGEMLYLFLGHATAWGIAISQERKQIDFAYQFHYDVKVNIIVQQFIHFHNVRIANISEHLQLIFEVFNVDIVFKYIFLTHSLYSALKV